MKNRFYYILLAVVSGVLISGCIDNSQPEPEQQNSGKNSTYLLSVKATKATSTKALRLAGSKINATWGEGDVVKVYNLTTGKELGGTLAPSETGTNVTTTKLVGEVTGEITEGDNLVLSFLSASYGSQDGTLGYIASNCDYAKDTVSVTAVDTEKHVATGDADFWNQQAIVRFTLKDESNNAINATSLTVKHGSSSIILSNIPAETYTKNGGNGLVYVAIPGFESEEISLTAVAGGKTYTFEKSDVTFTNGAYYPVNVFMFNELTSPLTFEAINDNTKITFEKKVYYGASSSLPDRSNIQYRINHGDWTNYDNNNKPTLSAGDKIQFRGKNKSYGEQDTKYYSLYPSDSCYVYGNIMSMIDSVNFATDVTFEADSTFSGFFRNSWGDQRFAGTKIKSHEKKDLALPATTLRASCYAGMFCGCEGITRLPKMPATQMAACCYREMFMYCTGLHEIPALQASQLADSCYMNMFELCTGLTELPANLLPATTLSDACYQSMFKDCTGLTEIPAALLPATTLSKACYQSLFNGCTGLTGIPAALLPAGSLTESCYQEMFSNCTGVTSVPSTLLPAMTLAKSCYKRMFTNCEKIDSAPYLPAQTLEESCYLSMFSSCDNLTNFAELTSTQLADSCYCYMFQYCESLPIAPALPATTLAKACYLGMFDHCDFSDAPVLNAPILVESCYEKMFSYCVRLTSVTCMATDNTATNCTKNWLDHVFTDAGGNIRTVTTRAGTSWVTNRNSWATSTADGIPTNWKHIEILSTPDFGEDCKWD